MCGIIGIIGKGEVAPLLLDGLRRLEYRGYDSAGIATLVEGRIERRRAEGKLANLAVLLAANPLAGRTGIGHTRWATHGAPNETNAHPVATERVAVVHNGIIENHQELRAELERGACVFTTETDTEVVAHLLSVLLERGLTPEAAMAECLSRLEGAFALAVLIAGRPDLLLAARRGSALAIGFGEDEMYLGSDALALAPLTQRVSYLEEGDWAVVTSAGCSIRDAQGREVAREIKLTGLSGALTAKGNHRHFMLKEIHEQPAVLGDVLRAYIDPHSRAPALPSLPFELGAVPKATIVACGTSWHAALIAKYWLEQVARLPVEVDIASEFRYRAADMAPGGLAIFVSQSGETIDTLAALRYARRQSQHILAIVNAPESSMSREADAVLETCAGPEIGVASTKAFTTQLAVLACLTLAVASARGRIDEGRAAVLSRALTETPSRVAEVLTQAEAIEKVAREIAEARDVLYLGRGTSYPIALEGALKLKEISYIHAEGYAAGEMKHGPIALIDEAVPVIVVAPSDELFDKTASNVQEVRARGGRIVLLSDRKGIERIGHAARHTLELPTVDPFVAPLVYAVAVQLLAYYAALAKGADIDQPRNLAKSVTVE